MHFHFPVEKIMQIYRALIYIRDRERGPKKKLKRSLSYTEISFIFEMPLGVFQNGIPLDSSLVNRDSVTLLDVYIQKSRTKY